MKKLTYLCFHDVHFPKRYLGQGGFPIQSWWNFIWSFKNGPYDIHLWPELQKKSDLLMFWWMSCSDIDLFDSKTVSISFPEDILSLLSVLYRSSCNKNSQTFLGSSIVPSLFEWTLLLFKCLFMSVILLWVTKTFISQLFTSCTLWFKLSVRGTISNINIDMVFFLTSVTVQGQWLILISY